MLLSLPTWIIHLLTVSEWFAAILFIHRYGSRAQRPQLRWFAYAMIPHLCAGLMLLGFHASSDRILGLLNASRLASVLGSLALFSVTLAMLGWTWPRGRQWVPRLAGGLAAAGLFASLVVGVPRLLGGTDLSSFLSLAQVFYLGFLLLLILVYRRDPSLFSPLTIIGFWFLLVFVAVTIVTTYIATVQLGLPSLPHADVLHGLSESLLSVANLLVALGALQRLRTVDDGMRRFTISRS
ncbi:MAG: DUF3593 domain-containing protein [Thiohalocapsa sp. PB-PSB1]|jgi:hypothetical protein|nr:MAG: hypothetical protein N838_29755 [Thiohalocapsa sp. PB-PSB1]QQO54679.1 MAG: DUF3593 domain-containing protein [Thiohalocapsa sp. PB-PSB1]HCS89970.1 DUF3593 domain-containing protein [Chromatiaceae bacterium]